MNITTTERIWWVIGGLLLLLTIAGATQVLAQSQESVYEEARELLNRGTYEEAALKYAEAYELARESEIAADALYWRAFSLYRVDETKALRRAVEVLEKQLADHPGADTHRDSEELLARIYGELAQRGERRAVRWIREHSDDDDNNEETRAAALQALMMMDPDRAMPIVKKILADGSLRNTELRRHAMYIVGQMRNEEAEGILIDMLDSETDPELASEIIMWLSMNGSDRSLDAIMQAYQQSKDEEIGEAALFALGQHGGGRAVAMLRDIIVDQSADSELRAQALHALSLTEDEDLAPLMIEVMRSTDDPELKEMALFALSRLEGDVPDEIFFELIRDPNANDELRAQALHFAGMRGTINAAFVKEIYDSVQDRDLKSQCCWVLSDLGTDEALDAIIDIVRNEEDEEVRQNAVYWIGQFDNETAAEFLLELINEE